MPEPLRHLASEVGGGKFFHCSVSASENKYLLRFSGNFRFLRGTLDLPIFKVLASQELHGLGISRRIGEITNGTFQVKPGSLFHALRCMEQAGWLNSCWSESENRRRQVLQADCG